MKEILLKILRRTFRMLLPTVILSALITWLNVIGLLSSRMLVLIPLAIGAALVVFLTVRFSRNNYFVLRDLKLYYVIELSSFLIFTIILLCIYIFGGNIVFTWMFSVTKFISYVHPGVPGIYASVFFDFILLIAMTVAPLGMKFLIMYRDKPDNSK